MAAALGIPASSYLIYCFFNLFNPLVSLLFSAFGIGNVKAAPVQPDPLQGVQPESLSAPPATRSNA
jgi:NhaC family Na+:H+ antiporter